MGKGSVRKDQPAHLVGFGQTFSTTMGGVQRFNEDVAMAVAGDHVGVLVKKIKPHMVTKGMLLVKPKSVAPTNHFEVVCYFLPSSEGGMVVPGDQATVRLTTLKTMPLFEGQKFTLRENKATVGTGVISRLLDPIPTHSKSKLIKLSIPNL